HQDPRQRDHPEPGPHPRPGGQEGVEQQHQPGDQGEGQRGRDREVVDLLDHDRAPSRVCTAGVVRESSSLGQSPNSRMSTISGTQATISYGRMSGGSSGSGSTGCSPGSVAVDRPVTLASATCRVAGVPWVTRESMTRKYAAVRTAPRPPMTMNVRNSPIGSTSAGWKAPNSARISPPNPA